MTDTNRSDRLFRMNALTGDICSVEDFDAWSDDEAITRALGEAGDQRIELWRRGRKLAAISERNGSPEPSIATSVD